MTFFTDAWPTARKQHRCGMCSRQILAGEKYRRGFAADGGRAWTYKECAHCAAFIRYAHGLTGEYEYGPDLLVDFEPETVAQARVRAQYRRRWQKRDGALYPIPALTWREDRYGFGWPVGIKPGADRPARPTLSPTDAAAYAWPCPDDCRCQVCVCLADDDAARADERRGA